MAAGPSHSPARRGALALLVGGAHAGAIAIVVTRLDHPVDALATAPGGTTGAVVGLVAAVAVPTYVAVRYRLVAPPVASFGIAAWAVYRELATPAPAFSTLGGYTVVHGARYVDAYVNAWYVWLFAALLLALAEHVARTDAARLPSPAPDHRLEAALAGDVRTAARTALVVGSGHAVVFLALAADWGYFEPDGFLPAPWYVGLGVLAWTVLGLVVGGGLPAWLLVRRRLVAPTVALAWLVWQTGWLQHLPLPDDPLPVYFLGWFFFAGVLLAVGGTEVLLRAVVRRGGSERAAA